MSRWTNTRPMFRITYVFESEAMDAFVQDFRTLQEANAALAARVRELEEAQGELLGLLFPAKSCAMCGRRVSDEGDGLDRDCGGDCWGCMVESCPDDPDVIAWHRKRLEGRR